MHYNSRTGDYTICKTWFTIISRNYDCWELALL